MTTPTTAEPTDLAAPASLPRHASLRNLALATVVAVALNTAGSQAHHHYAPTQAGGWHELPTYVVGGVIALGVAALGLLRVRRSRHAATTGRVALLFGALSVALFVLLYWLAVPFTWGAAAVLLARDAGTSRTARTALVLGVLGATLAVAAVVYRAAGGMAQT